MDGIKTLFTEKNLHERCKEIREKHNISVAEFARMTNCTRQSVYNFESGKNKSLQLYLAYERIEGDMIL